MMFTAQTVDGTVGWIDQETYLFGNPLITLKLRQIGETGFYDGWTGPLIQVDLADPKLVKLALDFLYPDATFSGDVPNTDGILDELLPDAVY